MSKNRKLVEEIYTFMENVFENEKFRLEFLPNEGIVDFFVKDQEIEQEDVILMHREAMRLTNRQFHCNLFRAMDFFSISPEARKEGEKKEYMEALIAQAFVVKNLAQKLIGNFILRFNRPKAETRMFSDMDEAKKWLHKKIRVFKAQKDNHHLMEL